MADIPSVQQISLSLSAERKTIISATAANLAQRQHDLEVTRHGVHQKLPEGFSFNIHESLSPFNVYVSKDFVQQVRDLHRGLDKALIDIVNRWVSDKDADFPSRMPLEKHEEGLLRWMDGPGRDIIPAFGENYGMWRTDFLIDKDSRGHERTNICEINSRIPFNGFWIVGYHEFATGKLGGDEVGLKPVNDFAETRKVIMDCFDHSKPLYHIRDKWPGVDSHPMAQEYQRRTGHPMITVKPSQLHLKPDEQSSTGYSLFYKPDPTINGETKLDKPELQKIDQCSAELFQEEYGTIDPLILQQMATRCVNDLRNVFLIHDKRILGIVQQELPSLEARGVLTSAETSLLQHSIAATFLPGSQEMKQLLNASRSDPSERKEYIIKPVRDASCNGIKIAEHLTQVEWLEFLERQASKALLPGEEACVVQRLVDHVIYDIVRHHEDTVEPEKFHLIGTYHMINSKLGIFGPWRVGEEVLISPKDKGIVMSTVVKEGD